MRIYICLFVMIVNAIFMIEANEQTHQRHTAQRRTNFCKELDHAYDFQGSKDRRPSTATSQRT